MFGAIPRKPGITQQYFHDHYRHPHGTMGRRISTMMAYTQSHHFHSDLLGDDQTYFEACAEVWIDRPQDAIDFGKEPNYVEHVLDDEPLFVDLEKLEFLFSEEEVLQGGVDWNDPDATYGDKAWDQDNDLELGRKIGALRHVRCRPNAVVHPDGAFAIGVRELYWPTQLDMEEGIAKDRAVWEELLHRPGKSIQFFATAERFM